MKPSEILLGRIPPTTQWGNWHFDPARLVLVHLIDGREDYEIDLEEIDTSAQLADWIFQIATKRWYGEDPVRVIGCLVLAFQDVLHPQAHYCSCSVEKGPVDPRAVLAKQGYLPPAPPSRRAGPQNESRRISTATRTPSASS